MINLHNDTSTLCTLTVHHDDRNQICWNPSLQILTVSCIRCILSVRFFTDNGRSRIALTRPRLLAVKRILPRRADKYNVLFASQRTTPTKAHHKIVLFHFVHQSKANVSIRSRLRLRPCRGRIECVTGYPKKGFIDEWVAGTKLSRMGEREGVGVMASEIEPVM